MTADELELLTSSAALRGIVAVEVSGCAYSCCGRGWERREHARTYVGYIDNLTDATFMLYSPGLGTVSYVCAVRFGEVIGVSADIGDPWTL